MTDDLPLVYKSYRIECVYQRVAPELREEVMQLWTTEAQLSPQEAARRCSEVAFIIRSADGELVGMDTVYVANFLQQNAPYYFLRMFIRSRDRGVPGLRGFLSRVTRDFLRDSPAHNALARGVVIATENPKFWRPGARRSLQRNGWNFLGKGPRGNELWYENFDGSLLNAAAVTPAPGAIAQQ